MINLELVSLKVKCERQYQTIIKLQDEKIDLFKENQQLKEELKIKQDDFKCANEEINQLKEAIEEAKTSIDYMIGNVDISEIHGTKLKQILNKVGDIDEKKN